MDEVNIHDRVAWETEGLLITCWLALQNDMKEVEYKPPNKRKKGNKGGITSISYRYGSFAGEPA